MSNVINIGTITNTNPSLWIETNTLDSDPTVYQIATSWPGSGWIELFQFCTVLSVKWIEARRLGDVTAPYGIANFDETQKRAMANTLISYTSMEDQALYATQELEGELVSKNDVIKGMAPNTNDSYPVGTMIWAGTSVHVVAYHVVSETEFELYDSNDGSITREPRSEFATPCTTFVKA